MNIVEINKERLDYLLSLYRMTKGELLSLINDGRKRELSWEDIYKNEIDVSYLKRIDKVFKRGLFYYADPVVPQRKSSSSVFFRKEHFSSDLNYGAKQRVREFEDINTRLLAISTLSDIKLQRKLPKCKESMSPIDVAFSIRDKVLPAFVENKRDYLKGFINKLGDLNVIVFEFVDQYNKKHKANIDGFFLLPNAIVLKRRQDSFSRELFTLAHELGHYLLGEEEIEEVDMMTIPSSFDQMSATERWCNQFAYYLLLGKECAELLYEIPTFDSNNDYGHEIVDVVKKATHLSRLAIFTDLMLQKKLSYSSYLQIRNELEENRKHNEIIKQQKKEQDIAMGIESSGRNPKPIRAAIISDIYNVALNNGVIGELEYCKAMNIKPSEIDKYLYQ